MQNIKVIGHRGAAGLEIENSFASFQKALNIGVDYIENDIRQLKDGTCVIFHDHLLNRLTEFTGRINTLTYEQIQNILLKNGEKIPTLDEYLDWVKDKNIPTVFELKQHTEPLKIVEKIRAVLPVEKFVVWSFFHDKVHLIEDNMPEVTTGLLFEGSFDNLDDYLRSNKAERVGLGFDSVDQHLVDMVKNAGKKLLFWVATEPLDIQDAIQYQPWGIVSNRPDLVKEMIGK